MICQFLKLYFTFIEFSKKLKPKLKSRMAVGHRVVPVNPTRSTAPPKMSTPQALMKRNREFIIIWRLSSTLRIVIKGAEPILLDS